MQFFSSFDRFWDAWPKNADKYTRKGAKAKCMKVWSRIANLNIEQILAHVEWLKTTDDWKKDGGFYIPAPLVYLNQQRWDGAEIPTKAPAKTEYERTKAVLKELERMPGRPPEGYWKELRARARGIQ